MSSDNVVQFPTESVRAWTVVGREMEAALISSGTPLAAREHVLERMKAFYEMLRPDFSFSTSITVSGVSQNKVSAICADIGNQVGTRLGEKLQAFTNALLIERLNREIEIADNLGLFD